MNRNDFINMIEDKVPVDRHMIGEVYELINIFPYFQSAHLLLLKGLTDNADVKFGNQLRNSAIHIADRHVLYYFLKTNKTAGSGGAKSLNGKERAGEKAEYDHQQTVIETARNSEQMIDEIERDSDALQIPHGNQDAPHGHSILITSGTETEESDEVMMLTDEESPADDYNKVFYMDPGFATPEEPDLLELEYDDRPVISRDNDVPEKTLAGETSGKRTLSKSELIDKFILENPRIEPNKNAEKTPPESISRPLAEIEGSFVTETLARIYVNQGYYSRAIDIYEKLSLKFPEKSSYFASQIELVKEYLKK